MIADDSLQFAEERLEVLRVSGRKRIEVLQNSLEHLNWDLDLDVGPAWQEQTASRDEKENRDTDAAVLTLSLMRACSPSRRRRGAEEAQAEDAQTTPKGRERPKLPDKALPVVKHSSNLQKRVLQAALEVIIRVMREWRSVEETDMSMNELWHLVDKNGDGEVNRYKLKQAMISSTRVQALMGMGEQSSRQLKKLFASVDTDNSRTISHNEFETFFSQQRRIHAEPSQQAAVESESWLQWAVVNWKVQACVECQRRSDEHLRAELSTTMTYQGDTAQRLKTKLTILLTCQGSCSSRLSRAQNN